MKKLYKSFLLVACAAIMVVGIMKGKMRDIELTPDKLSHHGHMMKAFPTIADATVTIHFWFEQEGDVTLQVMDLQGRVVAQDQGHITALRTHETIVDAAQLQNGTYIARLAHADGTAQYSKFVVAH